jgi:CheY-like chemotaxis protein
VDAEQNLPHVLADPQRLAQVFANLISNAVKFTPDDGSVTIGARRDGDGWVEFFVRDTGAGIRAEVVPHIFERFRQGDSSTTRRYGGLGIGLSVVRGLVELHGGRVRAESDGEGQGAAFIFRLPAADAPTAAAPAGAGDTREAVSPGRARRRASRRDAPRVLLVDDSLDTLAVVGRMLEAAGYAVTTAASPAEALERVGRETFGCVITDIGMPETDGFWLLERLRADEATARLPVVALTGYVSPFDRESILAAGFRAHLAKPIEPRALAAALEGIFSDPIV